MARRQLPKKTPKKNAKKYSAKTEARPPTKPISYVGIVTDNSGSMKPLRSEAVRDVNATIASVRNGASDTGIETYVSLVQCGVGTGLNRRTHTIVRAQEMPAILEHEYPAEGNTPLMAAVGNLIELYEKIKDPDATFLIMAITDGEENASQTLPGDWLRRLPSEMQRLIATDKWTFTFRVPRNGRRTLERLGVPSGNILEWEQTSRGFEEATSYVTAGAGAYYGNLTRGVTSTKSFFQPDLNGVGQKQVKAALSDISRQTDLWIVKDEQDGKEIAPFCERHLRGEPYRKGAAFYQLVKAETVQGHKQLAIRHKKNGAIYAGANARDLLGLPHGGGIRVRPGDHGEYDIYVQSTSYNRKLPVGTTVLYWRHAAH